MKAVYVHAYDRGFRVMLVEDGHSNFHDEAAKMIANCNRELSNQGIVTLLAPARVLFADPVTTDTVVVPMK